MKKSSVVSPVQKKWLSTSEAAKYLGASERFMKSLRDNAKIHYYSIGQRHILFSIEDLDNLVLTNKQL